jgi:hypothetical protein
VEYAGLDGDNATQPSRNGGLPISVVSPRHDGAVVLQGQTMVTARRDGHYPAQVCRDGRLPIGIISPGHDRAIALERQTVEGPSSQGYDVA